MIAGATNVSSRRPQLNAIKLGALVREHRGAADDIEPDVAGEFGNGAALMLDHVAWVLLDEQPERGLGAALAWAVRRNATDLHVLASRATGLLAREGCPNPAREVFVLGGVPEDECQEHSGALFDPAAGRGTRDGVDRE